jgi:hypothetical protein
MQTTHPAARALLAGTFGAMLLLATPAARSAPARASKASKASRREEGHACGVAFAKAQEREKAGQLRAARDLWAACARPSCIPFLRQECTTRYTQLDADIPSVVPVVTDEQGNARVDVEVSVDGEVLTSRLDGRALQVDPGMHEFVFKTDRGAVTQKIMIVQGNRNRPLAISLRSPDAPEASAASAAAAPPAAAPPAAAPAAAEKPAVVEAADVEPPAAPPARKPKAAPKKTVAITEDARAPSATPAETVTAAAPPPAADLGVPDDEPRPTASPLTYVLGTVGLAAMGTAGLMIYWGRKDNDLLVECSPACPPAAVDHIRHLYAAADVTIGVGVGALAGSDLVYVLTRPTPARPRPSHDEALLFDLQPAPSGAVATVSGRF